MTDNIVVVGAGAFGTALALSGLRTGANVSLYIRDEETATILKEDRVNHRYLPGVSLPEKLEIITNFEAVTKADFVLLVTPTKGVFETVSALRSHLNPMVPLIICSKGIDLQTQSLITDVLSSLVSNPLAVLSGPSFAIDIAHNLPVAVMLAAENIELATELSRKLRHDRFRCYASDDRIGVQIGGAFKNVLAIASGIVAGKLMGQSAQAALLARGLAEMSRFGCHLGGHQETFMGLAGVGDLILTGSSPTSRNYSLGFQMGQGKTLDEILQNRVGVTEGVTTSLAIYELAKSRKIYTPIVDAVYHLLHNKGKLDITIESLLSRQSDTEF